MKKLGDAYDTSPALTNQKSALENEYHYTANATANLDGSLKSKRIKACRQNDHIIKGTNNYYSNNNSSSNLTSELTDTKNESVQENAQLLSEDEFSQIKAVWKKIFLNNTPPYH